MSNQKPTDRHIRIGSIFRHSGHWECGSSCSYFQAVGLRGKTLVELRRLRTEEYGRITDALKRKRSSGVSWRRIPTENIPIPGGTIWFGAVRCQGSLMGKRLPSGRWNLTDMTGKTGFRAGEKTTGSFTAKWMTTMRALWLAMTGDTPASR